MKNSETMKLWTEITRGNQLYELVVEVAYSPGRPAPYCSNPDSPRFSDPGDPPSLEIKNISIDGCYDQDGNDVVPEISAADIELENDELDDLFERVPEED